MTIVTTTGQMFYFKGTCDVELQKEGDRKIKNEEGVDVALSLINGTLLIVDHSKVSQIDFEAFNQIQSGK